MSGTHKILVVEDDQLDQYLIKHASSQVEGFPELHFANSAEAALDMLAAGDVPALIVTDLNMPGIGGMELISRVKNDKTLREIPTVVFSTSSDMEDVRAAYQRYANSYIVKPDDSQGYLRFAQSIKSYWMEENRLLN